MWIDFDSAAFPAPRCARDRRPQPVACQHNPRFHQLFAVCPIAASPSVLGETPASESFVAFTMTMTRVLVSPVLLEYQRLSRTPEPRIRALYGQSNEERPVRQTKTIFVIINLRSPIVRGVIGQHCAGGGLANFAANRRIVMHRGNFPTNGKYLILFLR
jgi:hypothetical protein